MSTLHEITSIPMLPQRPSIGHKGTFGTTLVVGGSGTKHRMLGGPCLAAMGALRSGCGLAVLAVPERLVDAALTVVPEATGFALACDTDGGLLPDCSEDLQRILEMTKPHALAIGPGLGSGPGVDAVVTAACTLENVPRVIDADALNSMARSGITQIRGPVVLTPHPGEWNTLARSLGVQGDGIDDAQRPMAAALLARKLDAGGGPVVVVLKGARTVVSDGERFWRSDAAESVLAVGGSGDVLSGVVAGILAQCHPRYGEAARSDRMDAFEIACISVALHAQAGALYASKHGDAGMLARELASEIVAARQVLSGC